MKVKITQPNKLSEIKLSQYTKFLRTTKDSEDEMFIAKQLVGIFCSLPDNVVNQINAKEFDLIVEELSELLNTEHDLVTTFKMDGVEYGFIPDFEDITIGEKVDLDSFYQDTDNMGKAMNVLYRPITIKQKDKYLIKDYEGNGEFLDVTLDVAFGANVFFLDLMSDLLNYTQNFIDQEVAHNPKVSQTLEQNGVGTIHFTESLSSIISQLKKQLKGNYTLN